MRCSMMWRSSARRRGRDDLLQHIGVEDRALHVLAARVLAALDLQHRNPALAIV
jgi:hypothetical protein